MPTCPNTPPRSTSTRRTIRDRDLWLHVQEYAAPAEIPEADHRAAASRTARRRARVFALPSGTHRAEDARASARAAASTGASPSAGEFLVVREGDARLRVNLFDYLDTGLFLDHRPLRLRIAAGSRGHALPQPVRLHRRGHRARRGRPRRQTTTVDLSATYLQWCADNLQENGFGGARHRLVQADALQWLQADRGEYDLVFCDPPTFSNSKRARGLRRAARARARCCAPQWRGWRRDGVLYFSNNFRRFRLDDDAVAEFAMVEDISAQTIPPDFARDARIHRCWRLRRRD